MITGFDKFIGEIFIPNISGYGIVDNANKDELSAIAEVSELDYLMKMFGENLADDIIQAHYDSIQEGYEATFWDELLGLLTNQRLGSPLACYVYFRYRQNKITETTAAGEVSLASENATVKNPTYKLVKAWNNMVMMSEKVLEYVQANSEMFVNFDQSISFPFEKINSFGI